MNQIKLSPDAIESVEVNEAEDQPKRIVKDGYFLEEKELQEAAAGFAFYVLQFQNIDAARIKLGDEAIVALLNSKLNYDLRIKAKNKLPNPEGATAEQRKAEYDKLREAGQTLLLTPEEAEAHKPGEREMSSPESMLREAKKLIKDSNKPDTSAARKIELQNEAKALRKRAAAIIASQIED